MYYILENSSTSQISNSNCPDDVFNPIANDSKEDFEKIHLTTVSIMNFLRYLRWCPSFLNPPIQNEKFDYGILIPKLYTEAILFHQNPISTVKGALMRGLENSCIFKCKLCRIWIGLYTNYCYINVKKHLMDCHKIEMFNLDDFIEISLELFPLDFEKPLNAQSWIEIYKKV